MAANLVSDARRVSRTLLVAPARLLAGKNAPIDVTVLDISEQGIAISAPARLGEEDNCALAMDVYSNGKMRRVNFWGNVVYCCQVEDGFRIGIKFADMDTGSYEYIRYLSLKR